MTIQTVATKMQEQLAKAAGVHVEVTFCRADEFSIACLSEADLNKVRTVMSQVSNARLDDVEIDDECGAFAYYKF